MFLSESDAVRKVIRLSYTPLENGEAAAEIVFSDYSTCDLLGKSGPYGQWAITSTTNLVSKDQLDLMKEGSYWLLNHVRIKESRSEHSTVDLDLYGAKLEELTPDDARQYLEELLKSVLSLSQAIT